MKINLIHTKQKLTAAEKNKLSAQQLIPLKALDSGVILTPDNRLVMILRVDAINTQLLSNSELNSLFKAYEAFLKSITSDIQQTIVSQPIDLKQYIQKEKERLKHTKNFHKKKLLNNYIEYVSGMQKNKMVIQRQRYLVFDEKIKGPSVESYQAAINELEDKADSYIQGLKEFDLIAEPLLDIETIQYFHIFYDFEGAQNTPILTSDIPQIILGGHEYENEIEYEVAATKTEEN